MICPACSMKMIEIVYPACPSKCCKLYRAVLNKEQWQYIQSLQDEIECLQEENCNHSEPMREE